jgi:hypothetical protein
MRQALWIDLREPGHEHRLLLVDAPAPTAKKERETKLQVAVERLWPRAQLVSYAGGVAEFSLGEATVVAHFGPVRSDAELLPLDCVLPLCENQERHSASVAERLTGSEFQLSLL